MRQLTILFAAVGVLSGCASLDTTNLTKSADSKYTVAKRERATVPSTAGDNNEQSSRATEIVHEDSGLNKFPQVTMHGQGAEGMPQSLNSLPVGASDAY